MSLVLDKNEPGLGNWLEDGQSFGWNPGALITGLAGGQMNSAAMRHRALKSAMTNDLAEKIATNPASFTGAETLYLGKGAYTGIIDDVVNNTRFVQRTKRVIDNDKKRWHPGDANWWLIKAVGNENINLEELKRGGLGPLPAERRELKAPARICYIHGMVSAIVKSVSVGPWCAPYELATGTETTKMASCFACTTYMYATGFPPSSTHLGRGESWIPPKPELESGEQIEGIQEYFNKFDKTVMSSLNTRWHWDIYHYLRIGTNYLQNAKCLNDDYAGIANKLASILQGYKSEDIGQQGGNLYLDALTVHESDWRRIMRTLQPIYDEFANTVV
jgi:hypothetical protein